MARANFTIDLDAGNGWLIATDIECSAETSDGYTVDAVYVDASKFIPGRVDSSIEIEDVYTGPNPVRQMLSRIAWRKALELVANGDLRAAWDEDAPNRSAAKAEHRYDSNRAAL